MRNKKEEATLSFSVCQISCIPPSLSTICSILMQLMSIIFFRCHFHISAAAICKPPTLQS
jgi:hypothetical protein